MSRPKQYDGLNLPPAFDTDSLIHRPSRPVASHYLDYLERRLDNYKILLTDIFTPDNSSKDHQTQSETQAETSERLILWDDLKEQLNKFRAFDNDPSVPTPSGTELTAFLAKMKGLEFSATMSGGNIDTELYPIENLDETHDALISGVVDALEGDDPTEKEAVSMQRMDENGRKITSIRKRDEFEFEMEMEKTLTGLDKLVSERAKRTS